MQKKLLRLHHGAGLVRDMHVAARAILTPSKPVMDLWQTYGDLW